MAVYIPGVTDVFVDLAVTANDETESAGLLSELTKTWNGSVMTLRAPNTLSIIGIQSDHDVSVTVKSQQWDPAPTVDKLVHYTNYSSTSYDARHIYVQGADKTWNKNLMLILDDDESNVIEVVIDFGSLTESQKQNIDFSPVVVKNQLYTLSLFDQGNVVVGPNDDCMITFDSWLGPSPLASLGHFTAADIVRDGAMDLSLFLNPKAGLGSVGVLFKNSQHMRSLKGLSDTDSYLRLNIGTKSYEREAACDYTTEKVLLGMQRPIYCRVSSVDCPQRVVFTRRALHSRHTIAIAVVGKSGDHLNISNIISTLQWSYKDKNMAEYAEMGSTGLLRLDNVYEISLVVPNTVDYPTLKVRVDSLLYHRKRYTNLETNEMAKSDKVKNLMNELMIQDSSGTTENILSLYNLSNSLAVAKSFTSAT